MPRLVALSVLLTSTALAAIAPAQERLCGTCETTGVVDVEVSRRFLVEYEHGDTWEVLHCSEAIASDGMALDWEVCPRCKAESKQAEAQARWDAIAAAKHAWLEDRRRVDRIVDDEDVVHLETTHFVIAWNLPKISIDKRSERSHDAAHIYARRMEEFYALFQDLLGIGDEDNMRNKHYILCFEKMQQALDAGPVFANMQGRGTVRRAGGAEHESVLVMFRNKSEHPKDTDFHRHWIHSVTHQLTSVYYNPYWFGPDDPRLSPPWLADKYGWMDAGLAHWFEIHHDGEATTYCFQEQDTTSRWRGSDWTKNIWKAVMAENVPPFAETITKPTSSLSAREHQFVWSWVDYLMTRDAEAMGRAIKMAKHEAPVRDILRECYGLTTIGFPSEWAEWVKVVYAPNVRDEPRWLPGAVTVPSDGSGG